MRSPENTPSLVRSGLLIWGMVSLAHLATEIAVSQGETAVSWILLRFFGVLIPVTIAMWFSVRQRWSFNGSVTILAIIAMFIAMFIPLLLAPIRHAWFATGHAFEMQLLIGFRNISLVCLIWSAYPALERTAAVTTLFALLFCISTTPDFSLIPISLLYLLTGICWLSTKYWMSLKTNSVVGTQAGGPWFLLSGSALLLCTILLLFTIPQETRLRMVEGFLPSSGGTGKSDPYARAGIGDGDALVAATKEALSFAPIENAPFIEGNEPSLYDVFQDTYGAAKPPQKMERAIALPPELFQPNHHRMAEAKKSAKSFTLERESPAGKTHRHLKDTASEAVLHLVGRVPAHLRHTVYDLFDGYEWYPQRSNTLAYNPLTVALSDGKPWIRLPESVRFEKETHIEPHALRVMNVSTNCVLAPTNLQAIHIDRCDRADMFRWSQEGIVAMDRETLPTMTVIHLRSALIDKDLVSAQGLNFHSGIPEYRALPQGDGMDEIQQTAREWTRGLKTDLERIDAICRKLREGYRYNPDRVVPEGCANPVRWFLLESREGPDYLFATASVLLMRSLGISCRAVSGLYADPAHYDLSARQTSVFPDDTHWWAEVYLGNGSWLTVEPTPGYATLAPPRSLLLHVWVMLYKTGQLLARHWIATATILLLLGIMACYSRQLGLMFRITTLAWRYRQVTTAQALRLLVLQSVRLWDRQLELNQQSRPQGTTFPRFLRQQLLKTPESNLSETEAALLIEIYQWAAFSDQPVFPGEVNFQQIRHLCFQLLKPPQQTLLRQRLLRRNSAQTKQKVLPL